MTTPEAVPVLPDPNAAPPVETTPPAETTPPVETTPTPAWLSDDMLKEEKLKSFKSAEELAKAYLDTPEPAEIPETYKLPEGAPETIATWAKDNNLTQGQLDASLKMYSDSLAAGTQAAVTANEAGMTKLAEEWGDNNEANQAIAVGALKFGDPDGTLSELIKQAKADNNPAVWKFMFEVGKALQEGDFINSDTSSPATTKKTVAKTLFPNFK